MEPFLQYPNAIMDLGKLLPHPENPRQISPDRFEKLKNSIRRFGLPQPIVWNQRTGHIVAGHQRIAALRELGFTEAPVVVVDLGDEDEKALNLTLNNPEVAGEFTEGLRAWLDSLQAFLGEEFSALGLDALEEYIPQDGGPDDRGEPQSGKLLEKFLIPPFTVLDCRQGYWRDRKEAWLSLGIASELGRGKGLLYNSESGRNPAFYKQKRDVEARLGHRITTARFLRDFYRNEEKAALSKDGTSVFDPVLCELIYRWFCPPRGRILDPFAGGSVRGVVAGWLDRTYVGIDLSKAQAEANRENWNDIVDITSAPEPAAAPDWALVFTPDAITPVEATEGPGLPILVKRDDRCFVSGVRGGKVRTCLALAQGARGLVTAGSRSSPQVNIVAHIAQALGIPCRVHIPLSAEPDAPEISLALAAGAEVVRHPAGRNSVIIARAREDAEKSGWKEIPFGMECEEAITQTRKQAKNLIREEYGPPERIVIPVGSGMSLAGLLWGLLDQGINLPVLGVRVGANPEKRLDEYAPPDWRQRVILVDAAGAYDEPAPPGDHRWRGIPLDPYYEAKCVPFLVPGDLFWIVGIRESEMARFQAETAPVPAGKVAPLWIAGTIEDATHPDLDGPFDFLFTCPPYGNLEVYSDDPRDLSNMNHEGFLLHYRRSIALACSVLKDHSFAAIVVGDYRDKETGFYRNFIGETVRAFTDAGLAFYNEAILVTPLGSVPVLAGRQFSMSRKLGKTHQNVLVFVKGDPKAATGRIGEVEIGRILDDDYDPAGAKDEALQPV